MKLAAISVLTTLTILTPLARGQGTLQFDQQVYGGVGSPPSFGEGGIIQQAPIPFGQSFTPTLASVGFIRLMFDDTNPSNGLGATLSINLRAGSITGAVLSATAAVALPDSFRGTTDFLFPSAVPLTPGVMYYFEPLVQSGDQWNIIYLTEGKYPGGYGIFAGQPSLINLWFGEGVIVPEPSSSALILLGSGAVAYAHRRRTRKGRGRSNPI